MSPPHMRQLLATLSHGFTITNTKFKHVKLRELDGFDEQFLENTKNDLPIFLQTTELLKRVVLFEQVIDDSEKEKIFKNLSVGDRITLLLNLRKLTFGNTVLCIARCPLCKKQISLDISINDLLKSTYVQNEKFVESINAKNFTLKIRPLVLSDQQMILSSVATSDRIDHAEQLVRLCITSSVPSLPDEKLPEHIVDVVSSKLREIDPMADLTLDMSCPNCNQNVKISFDAEEFLLQEIHLRSRSLEEEIHWLAFHYHWKEHYILSLSIQKRQRYVELINKTLGESTT